MELPQIDDLLLQNKKVLLRTDFNVPFDDQGAISDDTRIRESLPTIEKLLSKGAAVIIMSHLGRPKGKKDPKFSLAPVAKKLEMLLKRPVQFCLDCVGPQATEKASSLHAGDVLLLENLRYYPAEEDPEKDPSFVKSLSSLGDFYVNDAFGTAHRAHSSTCTIAEFFPGKKAVGLLMQKEITALSVILTNPARPFYAIIGGAKISSKLGVIKTLIDKVDGLFIGGAMAFTFMRAQGISTGTSPVEEDLINEAKEIMAICALKKRGLWLPQDIVVAKDFNRDAEHKVISIKDGIPTGWQGMDVGPSTIETWKSHLMDAKTIFWNGPVGVFEFPAFSKGTTDLACILSELPAKTIVGGGDSVAAVNKAKLNKNFYHISTGGGASLEFIEFGHLPGIDALK